MIVAKCGGFTETKGNAVVTFTFSSAETFGSRWFQSLKRNKLMSRSKNLRDERHLRFGFISEAAIAYKLAQPFVIY